MWIKCWYNATAGAVHCACLNFNFCYHFKHNQKYRNYWFVSIVCTTQATKTKAQNCNSPPDLKYRTIIPHRTYWNITNNLIAYLAVRQNHHRHPRIDLYIVDILTCWSVMHSAVQHPQSTLTTTNWTEQTRCQTAEMQPTASTAWAVQENDSMQSRLTTSPTTSLV